MQITGELSKTLQECHRAARALKDIILTNLVMVSEIPAPTFGESERTEYIVNRFTEIGLQNSSSDEIKNAVAIREGTDNERTVLIAAHTDTLFGKDVDHTVTVHQKHIVGPGIGDNSLGIAALFSLPQLLDELDIKLKSDLVFFGGARSLGAGDLEGVRFFLNNSSLQIHNAICLEGVELGRLSYDSIGMVRGSIRCDVPEEYDWSRFGAGGAIVTLHDVIDKILRIPLPRRPRTSVVLGSIEAGAPTAYNVIPNHALLRLEIRSQSAEIVADVQRTIEWIVNETSSRSGADVAFDVIAQRQPGGLPFSHPLPVLASNVMKALGIQSRIVPSTSEISALIAKNIPSVTLGLSHSSHQNEPRETMEIEPIFTGLAQLVGILVSIDEGLCDEH